MASIVYSKASPYYNTDTYGIFLDVTKFRDIPYDTSDIVYEIDLLYNYRPDLLAYDLYGNSELWWVFAMRNPNTIKDPVFDFRSGTIIYIPKKGAVTTALGL
jgi:hypothetical protein